MGEEVPEVELLSTDNFWEWSVRIQDLLTYRNVFGALFADPEFLIREPLARAADAMALSIIRSHVSASILPYLMQV